VIFADMVGDLCHQKVARQHGALRPLFRCRSVPEAAQAAARNALEVDASIENLRYLPMLFL